MYDPWTQTIGWWRSGAGVGGGKGGGYRLEVVNGKKGTYVIQQ